MSKQYCVAGTPEQPCFQDLEANLKVDCQVYQSLTRFFFNHRCKGIASSQASSQLLLHAQDIVQATLAQSKLEDIE